jgi:hypothetical protein
MESDRPHTPARCIRPDVPRELSAAVDRLLARDRGQRFQSAREAHDALPGCSAGRAQLVALLREQTAARAAPRVARTSRVRKRAAVIGLAAAAAIWIASAALGGDSAAPDRATMTTAETAESDSKAPATAETTEPAEPAGPIGAAIPPDPTPGAAAASPSPAPGSSELFAPGGVEASARLLPGGDTPATTTPVGTAAADLVTELPPDSDTPAAANTTAAPPTQATDAQPAPKSRKARRSPRRPARPDKKPDQPMTAAEMWTPRDSWIHTRKGVVQ